MRSLGCSIVVVFALLVGSPSRGSAAQSDQSSAARGAILVQVTDTSINPLLERAQGRAS
jgi:hypothetical protein